MKTGRLKLAATHWERSLDEWNKTVPAEVDSDSVAKVQKELDAARVKLAKQNAGATTVKAVERSSDLNQGRCLGSAFFLLRPTAIS